MPEVKPPRGNDPDRSGTGQGALTKKQREVLADLWFYLQDERRAREYFEQVERMRNMEGKDAQWMQRNFNESYERDPEAPWERMQEKYSLGRPKGRVPTDNYEFPQPQDKWSGKRGESQFEGWVPPSQAPYNSDAWKEPEGFEAKPPPGWKPKSEGRDALPAASPAVAAVAAVIFARRKLLAKQEF